MPIIPQGILAFVMMCGMKLWLLHYGIINNGRIIWAYEGDVFYCEVQNNIDMTSDPMMKDFIELMEGFE